MIGDQAIFKCCAGIRLMHDVPPYFSQMMTGRLMLDQFDGELARNTYCTAIS